MFFKPSNFLFLVLTVMSTTMVVSSSSWMNSWMALEINLMSIIPILMNKSSFNSTNSSIKYFLIQAMASLILMCSFLLFFQFKSSMSLNMNNEMVLISLMMKSGIPPFHFWLTQVVESSEMVQNFMILTWQKIAPFMLISYSVSSMIMLTIMMSSVVGALGGINQNSIKKIMAYSSMVHGSWMMMTMLVKQNSWILYFMIYVTSVSVLCIIMSKLMLSKVSEANNSKISNKMKTIFMMNMLSMAGMPPFLGFFGKLMVICLCMKTMKFMFLIMTLVFSSLVSLNYYLKVCYSSFLMNEKKMMVKKNNKMTTFMINLILSLNLIGPMLVYLT